MKKALTLVFSLALLFVAWGCKGNLKSNTSCTPDCSGKECGNDGCGGICGACGPGLACSTDGMCVSSLCGNGRLDPGEACDYALAEGSTGSCDTMCEDDGSACTQESFFGNPQDCDAECRSVTIIDCLDDDGCCPSGCTSGNDSDCSMNCGDGTVQDNETCDGNCPVAADCDDANACTTDFIGDPDTCSAECVEIEIDECINGDGCCPDGCDLDEDDDCEFVCGDGEVTGPENCDNDIPAGDMGACPVDPAMDCPDPMDNCINAEVDGMADDCSAQCLEVVITDFIDGDGCCPDDNATADDDDDCAAVCGDNVVEGAETCDSAIPQGTAGYCPANDADCDDGDACTTDAMVGVVDECSAACEITEIMMPTPDDGCCYFSGLVMNEINDCQAMCDNYCTLATTNCLGANAIYTDDNMSGDAMDECMTACAAFDFAVGPPDGVAADADSSGDTLTCRIYHLGLADPNDDATQMTHCPHADPMSGNQVCVDAL